MSTLAQYGIRVLINIHLQQTVCLFFYRNVCLPEKDTNRIEKPTHLAIFGMANSLR